MMATGASSNTSLRVLDDDAEEKIRNRNPSDMAEYVIGRIGNNKRDFEKREAIL